MKTKNHIRTLKECEELIGELQKKIFHSHEVLRKVRMALHRSNLGLDAIREEIDSMWLHHLDGSDLLVSKFEIFQEEKIMDKDIDLLNCPFCGNHAYLYKDQHWYAAHCATINCITFPDRHWTRKEAIEKWNTRKEHNG